MAKGNGKARMEKMFQVLASQRAMQQSLEQLESRVGDVEKAFGEVRTAMTAVVHAGARTASTMEAMLDEMGKQQAELDDHEERLARLERKG